MRVLITRPREDAEGVQAILADHGIEALIEPLLEIAYHPGPAFDLSHIQALLMTSANGVRAFAKRNPERDVALYAVGDATAREAAALGFIAVHSAAGDVDTLADLVIENLVPGDGALLHPAGSAVAGDLAGRLGGAGFEVQREVIYTATPAAQLSDHAQREIDAGAVDGVMLYSPRTGAAFARLTEAAGLGSKLKNVTAYCLSSAVADKICDLPWAEIKTAARPDQGALMELLI